MSPSERDLAINAFGGAIKVYTVNNPQRAFHFDVTFQLDHPHLMNLTAAGKPPLHFHPYQEEYIKVLEGCLGVEVDGDVLTLTPSDGEFLVRPWQNHRLFPVMDSGTKTARFLLSGEETPEAFRLDALFFQNWYGYQDDMFLKDRKLNLIQVMNMFDAGGSYISSPAWVPFGKRFAQLTGIIIGRCLGGLLGYQPFYPRWTGDWQLACKKMETSVFLRRYSVNTKA
ncbi:hypothetical protein F4818DRAFT_411775 [Hypoxylon cercidicola]|nr:hypothetical protein F4818DRAFT_411775 [Hypoxylon cercidicola]